MAIARLFENGRSQAVRLPKEYRFSGDEVSINKIGDVVVLAPSGSKWDSFLTGISLFSDDFMGEEHRQYPIQEREDIQ